MIANIANDARPAKKADVYSFFFLLEILAPTMRLYHTNDLGATPRFPKHRTSIAPLCSVGAFAIQGFDFAYFVHFGRLTGFAW